MPVLLTGMIAHMHFLSFVQKITVMGKDGQSCLGPKNLTEGMMVGGALHTKSCVCHGG